MFYSQSVHGFFSPQIHREIPDDAVEITNEEWQALLDGQSNGHEIVPDENGYPVLVAVPAPAPPTPAELAAQPATITQGELNSLLARLETLEKKRSK